MANFIALTTLLEIEKRSNDELDQANREAVLKSEARAKAKEVAKPAPKVTAKVSGNSDEQGEAKAPSSVKTNAPSAKISGSSTSTPGFGGKTVNIPTAKIPSETDLSNADAAKSKAATASTYTDVAKERLDTAKANKFRTVNKIEPEFQVSVQNMHRAASSAERAGHSATTASTRSKIADFDLKYKERVAEPKVRGAEASADKGEFSAKREKQRFGFEKELHDYKVQGAKIGLGREAEAFNSEKTRNVAKEDTEASRAKKAKQDAKRAKQIRQDSSLKGEIDIATAFGRKEKEREALKQAQLKTTSQEYKTDSDAYKAKKGKKAYKQWKQDSRQAKHGRIASALGNVAKSAFSSAKNMFSKLAGMHSAGSNIIKP